MIRHLVMPNRVAGTQKFVRWVAANLPKSTYLNIMHQYHIVIFGRLEIKGYFKLASQSAAVATIISLVPFFILRATFGEFTS